MLVSKKFCSSIQEKYQYRTKVWCLSNHVLVKTKSHIWAREFMKLHFNSYTYSCDKITITWVQISRQNWDGFFSNMKSYFFLKRTMIFWIIFLSEIHQTKKSANFQFFVVNCGKILFYILIFIYFSKYETIVIFDAYACLDCNASLCTVGKSWFFMKCNFIKTEPIVL